MKKYLALVLGLVLTLTVAAGACAEGKLGMCAASLSFDFQLKMSNGIERAAKENGMEYVVYDYNFDNENMLSGLDVLKASGVTGMYGLFLSGETATPFMKANPEIGVLTQGAVVDGARACTAEDYVAMGENFVAALDHYVTENNITHGQIGALWLELCENEDNEYFGAKEQIKDVIKAWCEGKDFEFVAEYYPPDDETAANDMAQIMNAYPELNILFCFNNGYAIAAANEISSARSDVSNYFVFSSEGDDETFRLIESGTSPLRACTYMDIEESGYQVGLHLIDWIRNGKLEDVVVKRDLVDIRNIAEYKK